MFNFSYTDRGKRMYKKIWIPGGCGDEKSIIENNLNT